MAYVAGLAQSSRTGGPGPVAPVGSVGAVGSAHGTLGDGAVAAPTVLPGTRLASLVRQWVSADASRRAVEPEAETPDLPRRAERPVPPRRRLAVLIDAATTPSSQADALFDLLGDAGRISVCRAYADWTVPTSQAWRSRLRSHAIEQHHHFGSHGDQRALVAMTVDAMDLARAAAVDAVALVGDLASAHPLVARLNACGLSVVGLGPSHTPYDVRALCEEFVDLAFLDAHRSRGRHRS
jgi:NYN domain